MKLLLIFLLMFGAALTHDTGFLHPGVAKRRIKRESISSTANIIANTFAGNNHGTLKDKLLNSNGTQIIGDVTEALTNGNITSGVSINITTGDTAKLSNVEDSAKHFSSKISQTGKEPIAKAATKHDAVNVSEAIKQPTMKNPMAAGTSNQFDAVVKHVVTKNNSKNIMTGKITDKNVSVNGSFANVHFIDADTDKRITDSPGSHTVSFVNGKDIAPSLINNSTDANLIHESVIHQPLINTFTDTKFPNHYKSSVFPNAHSGHHGFGMHGFMYGSGPHHGSFYRTSFQHQISQPKDGLFKNFDGKVSTVKETGSQNSCGSSEYVTADFAHGSQFHRVPLTRANVNADSKKSMTFAHELSHNYDAYKHGSPAYRAWTVGNPHGNVPSILASPHKHENTNENSNRDVTLEGRSSLVNRDSSQNHIRPVDNDKTNEAHNNGDTDALKKSAHGNIDKDEDKVALATGHGNTNNGSSVQSSTKPSSSNKEPNKDDPAIRECLSTNRNTDKDSNQNTFGINGSPSNHDTSKESSTKHIAPFQVSAHGDSIKEGSIKDVPAVQTLKNKSENKDGELNDSVTFQVRKDEHGIANEDPNKSNTEVNGPKRASDSKASKDDNSRAHEDSHPHNATGDLKNVDSSAHNTSHPYSESKQDGKEHNPINVNADLSKEKSHNDAPIKHVCTEHCGANCKLVDDLSSDDEIGHQAAHHYELTHFANSNKANAKINGHNHRLANYDDADIDAPSFYRFRRAFSIDDDYEPVVFGAQDDEDLAKDMSYIDEFASHYRTRKDAAISDEKVNDASSVHEGLLGFGKAKDESSADTPAGYTNSKHEVQHYTDLAKDMSLIDPSINEASVTLDLMNAIKGDDDDQFFSSLDKYRDFHSHVLHKRDAGQTELKRGSAIEKHESKQEKTDKQKEADEKDTAEEEEIDVEEDLENSKVESMEKAKERAKLDKYKNFQELKKAGQVAEEPDDPGLKHDPLKTVEEQLASMNSTKTIPLAPETDAKKSISLIESLDMQKALLTSKIQSAIGLVRRHHLGELQRSDKVGNMEVQLRRQTEEMADGVEHLRAEAERETEKQLREKGMTSAQIEDIERAARRQAKQILREEGFSDDELVELKNDDYDYEDEVEAVEGKSNDQKTYLDLQRAMQNMDEDQLIALRHIAENMKENELRNEGYDEKTLESVRQETEREGEMDLQFRRLAIAAKLNAERKRQEERKRQPTYHHPANTYKEHLYNRAVFEKQTIEKIQAEQRARAEEYARAVSHAQAMVQANLLADDRNKSEARRRAEMHARVEAKALAEARARAQSSAQLKSDKKQQTQGKNQKSLPQVFHVKIVANQIPSKDIKKTNRKEKTSKMDKAAEQAAPAFNAFKTIWEHMRDNNHTDETQKYTAMLKDQSPNAHQTEKEKMPNLLVNKIDNNKEKAPEQASLQQRPYPYQVQHMVIIHSGTIAKPEQLGTPKHSEHFVNKAHSKFVLNANNTAARATAPADKGLISVPISQPLQMIKSVLEKLFWTTGEAADDIEVRCPVHVQRNSNGEVMKDAQGHPVEVCQCRIVKTDSTSH